ncbi:MAG: nuclear transport factor 2 family protein [Acidisphaera sp.]|nr:nuclear transport factor 2 family protein [Acidisphaera sp.]
MARPTIAERFDIDDLFTRYAAAIDRGDVGEIVACFVPDGWLDSPIVGRYEGPDGIRAFAEMNARAVHERGVRMRHVISNLRIDIEGDRGRATCYLLDIVTRDGVSELLSPGEYDCELIRTAEGWRFASRIVRMDRQFPMP